MNPTAAPAGLEQLERLFDERRSMMRDGHPSGFATAPPTLRPPRRWLRRLLVAAAILLVIVVALSAAVGLLVGSITSKVQILDDDKVFPPASGRPSAAAGVTNLLVIGTDSREGLGTADDTTYEGSTGQRADTMMLVNLSADGEASVISLMRDSWVDIPGHGEAKLNAALAWGGVPLVVQTVEQLTGAHVDHVAVADFSAMAEVTTALGGVPVTSPTAFDSRNMPGFHFSEGLNIVQGDRALAFARERYSFGTGDYQRVRNQRSLVAGILTAVRDRTGAVDVARVYRSMDAAAGGLATDSGLNPMVAADLLRRAAGAGDGVVSFTLPTRGTAASADGQSIVVIDEDALAQVRRAFQDDDVYEAAVSADWSAGR